MKRAYWDAAHHVPPHPAAVEALCAAIDDGWADPFRLHREGRRAAMLADGARQSLAADLGVRTEELGTAGSFAAAAHAAALGTLRGRARFADLLVHSPVDHSALLAAADWHRATGGRCHRLGVDRLGRVDAEEVAAQLADEPVAAVLVQAANAEVGTLQPLDSLLDLTGSAGVPLISDVSTVAAGPAAVTPLPAAGVLVADPAAWGSPPGVGLLAVRAAVRWRAPGPPDPSVPPDRCGAPGGAPIPQLLAAAVALRHARAEAADADARRRAAIERLRAGVARRLTEVELVGDPVHRLPHVLTFSCLFADGEAVVEALDAAGFAVGSGSACTASTLRPSHVLAAMGVLTHGNVRIALPATTPTHDLDEQVEQFLAVLPGVVTAVRDRLGAADLP
jgi:cysteine desulfurase